MIVEIPKNSANKYEYDAALGIFRLDRPLYSPMHYPGDFGFIPGTLAEDGDPVDVLSLVDEPSFTGCTLEVRPVGLLDLVDNFEADQKILGVPSRDPRFNELQNVEDIPDHTRKEIEHFFSSTRNWKERPSAPTEGLAAMTLYAICLPGGSVSFNIANSGTGKTSKLPSAARDPRANCPRPP